MTLLNSPIVPAIIPASKDSLLADLERLSDFFELHLDVVDGQFVPFRSWPFGTDDSPSLVRSALDKFSLEVDLMVSEPVAAAEAWLLAGADQLVLHAETISVAAFQSLCADAQISIGIAAGNDLPFSTLASYIPHADYVQVMGIAKIGSQGQPFDERALSRLRELAESFPDVPLSIDGSVNRQTLPLLQDHGLSRYIVGSALMGAGDPVLAHAELSELIRS